MIPEEKVKSICKVYSALISGNLEEAEKTFNIKKIDITILSRSKSNWLHEVLKNIPNTTPIETINYLIKKGVSPTAKDCYGMTPLHYAVRGKNIEAAKILLNAGADPNALDISGGLIPFKMACSIFPFNHELINIFLQYGADVHIIDNITGEPLSNLLDIKYYKN